MLFTGLAVVLLSGCSWFSSDESKPIVDHDTTAQDEAYREKVCADPKWKAEHLGLWFSICSRADFSRSDQGAK